MTVAEKILQAKTDYDAVYDAGIKQGIVEYWKNAQRLGLRQSYAYAFAYLDDDSFLPQYDISPIFESDYMFQGADISAEHFKKVFAKIKLDLSKLSHCTYIFANLGQITELPFDIDVTYRTSITGLFSNSRNLVTIKKLKVTNTVPFNNCFDYCTALENITIEGTIGMDGLNLQWSTKLSKASMISIINALSTSSSGKSITISKIAKETNFEVGEWADFIATKPNWTINLI